MKEDARIAGLVLAAGASLRHPEASKLLLPFGGETVVSCSVRAAVRAGLEPVVVVLGDRAPAVRRAVGEGIALFAINERYREGIGTSLASGIRRTALEEGVEAAAILLGDEPGVSSRAIRTVVDAWSDAAPAAARAMYRDRPGHPVVVGCSLFSRLERAEGDRGLSAFLGSAGIPIQEIFVEMDGPVDIDTPEDYRRALEAAEVERAES